jgi:class 3 adenylate cyclase
MTEEPNKLRRIICIEDSETDFALFAQQLKFSSIRPEPFLSWAKTLAEGSALLAESFERNDHFDLVVLDLNLPDSFGAESYLRLRQEAENIPIVILSGSEDDALSLSLVKEGAQDFLTKDDLSPKLLSRTLLYAMERQELRSSLANEKIRRERLSRHFSDLVAKEIENSESLDTARQMEVTVLFADLRDFTTLVETLDPLDVVTILNEYYERMVSVVYAHGGTLDKYMGDGLMIYFGAPLPQEDQALRAVRCALHMQQALRSWNEERQGQVSLRMGVGIHSGLAIVGSIGALHRREYTAIGDTVNVAARIEKLCKTSGENILVSLATQTHAEGAGTFREVMGCAIRGRSSSVQIFAVE